MLKLTWLNSKRLGFVLAVGIVLSTAAAATAGGPVDVTSERATVCAKADERYAELYPDPKDEGVVIVKLYKYNFCPANVTVKPGTTVRWVNVDKRTSHSVWLKEANEAESDRFFPEESWEFQFQSPGEYPYLCGPHWENDGMIGYVKVEP